MTEKTPSQPSTTPWETAWYTSDMGMLVGLPPRVSTTEFHMVVEAQRIFSLPTSAREEMGALVHRLRLPS